MELAGLRKLMDFDKMNESQLEEIVAEHINMDGNKLADPMAQPGMKIKYNDKGTLKEAIVMNVSM